MERLFFSAYDGLDRPEAILDRVLTKWLFCLLLWDPPTYALVNSQKNAPVFLIAYEAVVVVAGVVVAGVVQSLFGVPVRSQCYAYVECTKISMP